MRVFLQRVSRAAVHIDGELAGSCGRGLLLLLGVCPGEALATSQFTRYADTRRGRRPSFSEAAAPTLSEPLYEYFVGQLRECGKIKVACGRFGADMQVSLVNDGPVSIMLEKNA